MAALLTNDPGSFKGKKKVQGVETPCTILRLKALFNDYAY